MKSSGASIVPHSVAESHSGVANSDGPRWECHRLGFFTFVLISEIIMIVAYALTVEYSAVAAGADADLSSEDLQAYYPFFQDVNVMIFVGFGFLMTFLHKYGFSSVGYNFVLAAFSVQIAVLFSGLWERIYEDIYICLLYTSPSPRDRG